MAEGSESCDKCCYELNVYNTSYVLSQFPSDLEDLRALCVEPLLYSYYISILRSSKSQIYLLNSV